MTTTSRFSTLLLREWMQHKRGWLITVFLPPLLFLALLPWGTTTGLPLDKGLMVGLIVMAASTIGLFGIAWLSAMFQVSGLARRDNQDRSIEFWLSLPAGHSESIGATILAHALLVPLAAAVVGFAFGGVIAGGLVIKQAGMSGLASVPWTTVFGMSFPLLLRGLFGVLLMTLWIAPLIMIVMTASAWLKRWGVPAVALTIGVGGAVLEKLYGSRIIWDLLAAQRDGAIGAFVADPREMGDQLKNLHDVGESFNTGAILAHDAWLSVQNLASPYLIGGLLIAAGCFAALVYKRSRAS